MARRKTVVETSPELMRALDTLTAGINKAPKTLRGVQLVINDVQKTGDFEIDVRAGYYDKSCHEWHNDFVQFFKNNGVPEKYASRVASYAWQRGHYDGYSEVLNVSYDLIEIFKEN
jgi:hypothetical protein